MIIDASALLAIVLNEPDGRLYAGAVLRAQRRLMPTVTWCEASMVVERHGDDLVKTRFDQLVRDLGISLIGFTATHAAAARVAWADFGRARHPARLNFGDCMVYAVAKCEKEPLLFRGDDFAQTDIEPALKG